MKSKENTHYNAWKVAASPAATDVTGKCHAQEPQSLAINISGIFRPNASHRWVSILYFTFVDCNTLNNVLMEHNALPESHGLCQ